MKIFLHIGAGKCASSTIQKYFSYNNVQGKFAYACLNKSGGLLTGTQISNAAEVSVSAYAASQPLEKNDINACFINKFRNNLKRLAKSYETLLLSHESWQNSANEFSLLADVLKEYEVEIIMIVRPPLQWLNSAWWQWFKWDDKDEDDLAEINISAAWMNAYNKFSSMDFIKKSHVISMKEGFMNDFFHLLDLEPPQEMARSNEASSQELLSFMSHNRALRPYKGTPSKEFVLNKYLRKRSSSNWVLRIDNMEKILKLTRPHNMRLAQIIANEDITKNPAWWDISFYEDKVMSRDYSLSAETMNDMLVEAYEIIFSLDEQARQKKKQAMHFARIESEADTIFNAALKLENKDLDLAHQLMTLAHKLKPEEQYIKLKLDTYCANKEALLIGKNRIRLKLTSIKRKLVSLKSFGNVLLKRV